MNLWGTRNRACFTLFRYRMMYYIKPAISSASYSTMNFDPAKRKPSLYKYKHD